jgi:rhamnosyltransferase
MIDKNYPKVIVLLPTFNGERWVVQQIESVLSQQGVDVTLIVRDDFSTDSTLDLIKREFLDHPKVKYLASKSKTGCAGQSFMEMINRTDVSSYDYIAFCDQDDIWLSDKLLRAVNLLNTGRFAGYSSSVLSFWKTGREVLLTQNGRKRKLDFILEGAGQGCNFVFSRAIFLKIQFFCKQHVSLIREFYYHDWLTYLLIRSWGLEWHFDSEYSMKYRQHNSNDTGSRASISGLKKRFLWIKSGWYRRQVEIAVEVALVAATGNINKTVQNFGSVLQSKTLISRRIKMAFYMLVHGRRRLFDRVLLSFFSIIGYL